MRLSAIAEINILAKSNNISTSMSTSHHQYAVYVIFKVNDILYHYLTVIGTYMNSSFKGLATTKTNCKFI